MRACARLVSLDVIGGVKIMGVSKWAADTSQMAPSQAAKNTIVVNKDNGEA